MKVYDKNHAFGAGKWIYEGYLRAWDFLGYEVEYYDALSNIEDDDFFLFTHDSDIAQNLSSTDILDRANKVFLFVQPKIFPHPWGSHPNFVTSLNENAIQNINSCPNIIKWSFCNTSKYDFHNCWLDVHTVHLGFDHLTYKPLSQDNSQFDICYVGSWANNGFDEKRKIMMEYFKEFKNMGINAGIFINKNLTIQQEADLLFNSKISINIHDNYQRVLGLDTNERTFKAMGLNGFLISDKVDIIGDVLPSVQMTQTPQDMCEKIKENLDKDLTEIKVANRKDILENHTYVNRVRELLEL